MKGGSRKLEGCRWSEKLTFQLSYRLDGSIDGGLKKQGRLEKRVQLEKTLPEGETRERKEPFPTGPRAAPPSTCSTHSFAPESTGTVNPDVLRERKK